MPRLCPRWIVIFGAMTQLTIQQAFELAVQQQQSGRLEEAEKIYRQILVYQPGHADAQHRLGLIAHQMGRIDAAEELIRARSPAIPLRPKPTSVSAMS